MGILYPNDYVYSWQHIDVQKLKAIGIKALMFDLDNTLVPWNSGDLQREIRNWFVYLHQTDFKTCIVSNNSKQRVLQSCDFLQTQGIYKAAKPRRKAFRQAMQMLDVSPTETAMVGDQVFTDILGANRLGLYTILVVPMSKQEFIGTRINRQLEKLVLRKIKHRLIQ
ncbi:MAG: YqeG family HAD IIIA-type phosphatase [Desulfotomaculum sp.]|nr:YqeG family HAD IIIA-type phosphatase [Desulfotomaculum sp.]